jgi:phage shock protein A
MPSIFKRLNSLIAASVNDLVDRAEDPERMIKQFIREMEEHIQAAKEGVIEAVASEKQLASQVADQKRRIAEWLQKAEDAIGHDREDLARSALERKKEHERILQSVEPAWQAAKETSAHLKQQLQRLESKLEEAKLKRGTLVARQRAAEARQHMERTAASFHAGQATHTDFARMEDKVSEIEARAAAEAELSRDSSDLEREFTALQVDSEVEDELAQLKQRKKDQET